jgi:hypothetical protein
MTQVLVRYSNGDIIIMDADRARELQAHHPLVKIEPLPDPPAEEPIAAPSMPALPGPPMHEIVFTDSRPRVDRLLVEAGFIADPDE